MTIQELIKTENLISEVGSSHEEQLAQEKIILQKEVSKGILGWQRPLDPKLKDYITTNRLVIRATAPPKEERAKYLKRKDILQEKLAQHLFHNEQMTKKQIYLHHTSSVANPMAAINWWRNHPAAVGACMVIAGRPHSEASKYKDGQIFHCFPTNCWAQHLGLTQQYLPKNSHSNLILNQQSIAIELANWGNLVKQAGKFKPMIRGEVVENVVIPPEQVVTYSKPFRGFQYYHKYSDAQILNLFKILEYLCEAYHIPAQMDYNIFDLCPEAFSGTPGIFTHASVRLDKMDAHPQPELIDMLNSL